MINDFIASDDAWKIQMILKVLFISSKDTGEERDMNIKKKDMKLNQEK